MSRDKANLSFHGTSWNAPHMDSFLQSEWGDKLFVAGKTRSHNTSIRPTEISYSRNTVIRPSPAFLALPRNIPPVSDFQTMRTVIVEREGRSWPVADVGMLAKEMKALEVRKQELQQEAMHLMPALARKRIYEAEKKQLSDYSVLKSQRLFDLKRRRILSNEFRNCGVRRGGDRSKSSVLTLSANSVARTDTLTQKTKTHPDIEFHNVTSTSASPRLARIRQHRNENSHHYHNTHECLFVSALTSPDPRRLERLTQLTRGNRSFNIVTGTSY